MSADNGTCVGCKSAPYSNANERLCIMCYGSPFYKQRRLRGEAPNFLTPDGGYPSAQLGGLRFDTGKSRVDLIPADALLVLGEVYHAGDIKYSKVGGPRNWEKGMHWSKLLGPLLRHLFKWMMGETWDMEDAKDGAPPQRHIAKVVWNAIGLLTYEIRGTGIDDARPYGFPSKDYCPKGDKHNLATDLSGTKAVNWCVECQWNKPGVA